MIVWHGGMFAVETPDLLHSRKAVDFGPGFYVTPIRDQAVRWCEHRKLRFGFASLSSYEYDEQAASDLKVLRFTGYTEEWLDFVVNCRSGRDTSDWDIVVGGMADDRVFNALEAYLAGFADKKRTIGKLRMLAPNLQICLRTQAALGVLKYLGSEPV